MKNGKLKTKSSLHNLQEQCRERYHERCIVCGRHSRIVHEIIPRSSGETAINIENMVVLCSLCHDYAHAIGTEVAQEVLNLYKKDAIGRYGDKTR